LQRDVASTVIVNAAGTITALCRITRLPTTWTVDVDRVVLASAPLKCE